MGLGVGVGWLRGRSGIEGGLERGAAYRRPNEGCFILMGVHAKGITRKKRECTGQLLGGRDGFYLARGRVVSRLLLVCA